MNRLEKRPLVKTGKRSQATTCLIRMANGKRCMNTKSSNQLSCTSHWHMVPEQIQDEVWAGYHANKGGCEHLEAIKKCMKIWHEKG